ncbi:Carbohydrate sulfotransferase 11 [Penaeus vannamei]|uniref:Carbohydrate sulfotransferase n=1 Tax=Penaeus vannamei TaxID=6689 RepID=A0A423TT67_PENVA|nr:Carbohydrate sulfotransferase 11 [Penaeus vannamei]
MHCHVLPPAEANHQTTTEAETKQENGEETEQSKNVKRQWESKQEERKQAVREACRGRDREYLLEHLLDSPRLLGHLLVDDGHRAIYCYVPKVSCTTWKQVWAALTGTLKTSKKHEIPSVSPHYLTKKMSLLGQKLSREELRRKIQTYTKFLVVRHPLERLLSAFRNKLEGNGRPARVFKRVYGAKIIREYRRGPESSRENTTSVEDLEKESAKTTGEDVRFSEFVSFLLDKKDLAIVNEHWRPYESLCHPCALSYDVIAKYESLEEDSERFLRLIGAPEGLHFPQYAPTNTSALLHSYLASVKPDRLAQLMMAYQRDFQLFQYDVPPPPAPNTHSSLLLLLLTPLLLPPPTTTTPLFLLSPSPSNLFSSIACSNNLSFIDFSLHPLSSFSSSPSLSFSFFHSPFFLLFPFSVRSPLPLLCSFSSSSSFSLSSTFTTSPPSLLRLSSPLLPCLSIPSLLLPSPSPSFPSSYDIHIPFPFFSPFPSPAASLPSLFSIPSSHFPFPS